jgi:L-amino acid N-acyltransferase
MTAADASGRRPPAPVIRCGPRHLPAIRGIFNHEIANTTALYEYEPRSAETVAAWFAAKEAAGLPVLGVEADDGSLAGFATFGPFRPFAAYVHTVEHSLYVDRAHRGRGIGRTLLEAVVAEARGRGLHVMVGGIDSANTASIALHRRLGFTPAGTIREAGWKFGRWLDLEFWQLVLALPLQLNPVEGMPDAPSDGVDGQRRQDAGAQTSPSEP